MKFIDMEKLKKDYEKTGFLIFLLIMAVYYGYRLFALTPWYDELYTYYYFISRGPVYAAIHWPVPNNHVGYSVLSAFLDFLGNPYIGLRGVSYLCALANLILIFGIGRRFLKKGLSLVAVLLYASMNLVNQMAVQGRGYTLGITCYLTAFYCLTFICKELRTAYKYYVVFGMSLVLGLYTLTSDIYFVLPVCMTGGMYLLYQALSESKTSKLPLRKSEYLRKLGKLITVSILAAIVTTGLYAVIWLAIGSNLLVKDETGLYYGMNHVKMILTAPFDALRTGIEYMLSTPYIQSVERQGYFGRLLQWMKTLMNWYYDGFASLFLIIVLTGICLLIWKLISGIRRKEKDNILFLIFLLSGIICIPLFLTIQCALPYYRVFTYGGVLLAFLVAWMFSAILEIFDKAAFDFKNTSRIKKKGITVVGLIGLITILSSFWVNDAHHGQYSMREYQIQDALSHSDIKKAEYICVTDCTQQYLMKFLHDITCENTVIEGSDYLLLDKKMMDPEYNEMEWEFYHYYNTIPWDYVNVNMKQVYENESFVLYIKNT